jgi:Asp-tRNA(Asn)/Glu-tRNA(Gln) amidotransferase A subunit family amidase
LEQGRAVLGSDYAKALWTIDRVRAQVATFFEQFDLLITPTVAVKPPRIAEALIGYDKPGHALAALNVFSPLANIVDAPSSSMPCGFTPDGLPVGLMITARRGLDDLVLQASAAFEELSPWRHLTPPLSD